MEKYRMGIQSSKLRTLSNPQLPHIPRHRIQKEIIQQLTISKTHHRKELHQQLSREFDSKITKLHGQAKKIVTLKQRLHKLNQEQQQKRLTKLNILAKKFESTSKNKQDLLNQIVQKNKAISLKRKEIQEKVKKDSEAQIIESNSRIAKFYNQLQDSSLRKNLMLMDRSQQAQDSRYEILKKESETVNINDDTKKYQRLFSKSIPKVTSRRFRTNSSRLSSAQSQKTLKTAKLISEHTFQNHLEKVVKKAESIENARKSKTDRFQKALNETHKKKQFLSSVMKKNSEENERIIQVRNSKIIQQSQLNRKKLEDPIIQQHYSYSQDKQQQYSPPHKVPTQSLLPTYHQQIKNKLHGLTLYFYNSLGQKEAQFRQSKYLTSFKK